MSVRRALLQKIGTIDDRFIFTVKTDNEGDSANNQFTLPLVPSFNGVTAEVDWGDGSSDTITSYVQPEITHTYPSIGTYEIKISGELRGFRFNNSKEANKLLTIENWGIFEMNENHSFWDCNNLTTVTATDAPTITTSSLFRCFDSCDLLTSINLTGWDIRAVSTLQWFFNNCPSLETIIGLETWDFSSVGIFTGICRSCSSLVNFPANVFDDATSNSFQAAFDNTNLSQTSIDNILVSIESIGNSGGTFNQSGGSAPSSTGKTAIDALRDRDWTVTVTEGY